jgi:hypothetical protein
MGKSGSGSAATTGGLAMVNPYLAAAKVGLDMYSGYRKAKSSDAMKRYNAKIMEQDAIVADSAIKEEGRRLAETQRGIKAKQRMSVSGRGGLESGTDLLTLADEAEKMQLDQLEIMRQRQINKDKSAHQAYMTRFEAKAAENTPWGKTKKFTKKLGKAYIFDFDF